MDLKIRFRCAGSPVFVQAGSLLISPYLYGLLWLGGSTRTTRSVCYPCHHLEYVDINVSGVASRHVACECVLHCHSAF